ncbi:ADP-ribosylglycohydrolase family protein [Hydrogenivirga sp. 128-5-R1-1]|uniref:ADP-ribosylglycohydrolase family protein n=1 Tax=Hydrogenivirga sp. 128-5-R1-1 TaxID=392423 RepID=UPI00015F174E|nr:ADP-ribosylglycohydrolase family protein [Hydrogenivirga sp. 128-5-R1-1]EDP76102.1 ADP-ribosylglycohydrolase [Hydrogenivirga sp. 128-5-R1-1]
MQILRDKFKGTILGAALGDALGKSVEDIVEEEVYEFYGGRVEGFVPPHPSSPAHGQLPEETSDETTIMVLLLESLVSKKEIDLKDFLNRLVLWYEDEASHRYPDPALLTAVDLLSRGVNPTTHGLSSTSIEGILRSVVVGLYHYHNPELAAEGSKLVSMLTHRSDAISEGAAVLGALISYLVLEEFDLRDFNERIRLVNALKRFVKERKYEKTLDLVQELLYEQADLSMAIRNIGNGSYVFEALPLSLFIFLSNIDNPLEGLWWAVNSYGDFGGDTDSIGFLVGSFLGAYFGESVFPRHLIEELENSNRYEELAEKLYDITENMIIRR